MHTSIEPCQRGGMMIRNFGLPWRPAQDAGRIGIDITTVMAADTSSDFGQHSALAVETKRLRNAFLWFPLCFRRRLGTVCILYFLAIIYFVWFAMAPFEKMLSRAPRKTTFHIVDFFSLTFLLSPPWLFVVQMTRGRSSSSALPAIFGFLLMMVFIVIWGHFARILSGLGVEHAGKRYVFLGIVLPMLLIVPFGAAAISFALETILRFSQATIHMINLAMYALLMFGFSALLRVANDWVFEGVANPWREGAGETETAKNEPSGSEASSRPDV